MGHQRWEIWGHLCCHYAIHSLMAEQPFTPATTPTGPVLAMASTRRFDVAEAEGRKRIAVQSVVRSRRRPTSVMGDAISVVSTDVPSRASVVC